MIIDGCEVEVEVVNIEATPVVLRVEDINGEDDMLLSLFLSRTEAMHLGGLLIGVASAVRVPLVEKPAVCRHCGEHMFSGLMCADDGVVVHIKCDPDTYAHRLSSEAVTQAQVDALNTVLAVPRIPEGVPRCACPQCSELATWEGYCDACHGGGC